MAELKQISYRPTKGDNVLPDYKATKASDRQEYHNSGFDGDTQNGEVSTTSGNHNGEDIDDDTDNDENATATGFSHFVEIIQTSVSSFVKTYSRNLWIGLYIVLLLGYLGYFSYAMYYRFGDEGSWRLMVVTVVVSIGISINMLLKRFPFTSKSGFKAFLRKIERIMIKIRFSLVLGILLVLGFIAYVVAEIAIDKPRNLISLGGLIFFIFALFVFSNNPSKVKWRPVYWGVTIQVIFALLILRTSWGRAAFEWLGDRVTEFLAYTNAGSGFVFGNLNTLYFAFQVLPVVIFFSTFVSILYYLGAMQVFIKHLGRFLSFCLGTSPTESVNAAGNIFIGQTEAPLLIRPFLKDMTKSEIHAVMTGGFATIAGGVMAAYISLKVPATHLLSASVMSAPAALAVAKLFYPETEKSKHKAKDVYNIAKGTERNLIEAASNGASMSISLVANIAVNLLAFVALLQFVNSTLIWFGDRVGYGQLTFELICSYIFWPLSFLMGVDPEDCRIVAQLVGTKTILNEFVAYTQLSVYINNSKVLTEYVANATANVTHGLTGVWYWVGNDIFLNDTKLSIPQGIISERSVIITTYALCGFSNLSSMGVQLGALGAMAPERKSDMSKIVFRAMIAGNVACFLTACIAGLFYEDT